MTLKERMFGKWSEKSQERKLNPMKADKDVMHYDYLRQPGNSYKRRKRLYIVNRTRFVIMSLITLIILSTILTYVAGFFMSEATTNHEPLQIEVMPGDTLWDIAASHNYYEEDIRAVVYRIKQYNDLSDGTIYTGQVILVPTSNH